MSQDKVAFEVALEELESLVAQMETGTLSLEDALQAFERGIQLTRACQQKLQAAEQQIRILTQNHPDAQPEVFADDV
ncbi:MAG: exodeoxyribonuclease VII small subunit [Pseudomonadota bacterium]